MFYVQQAQILVKQVLSNMRFGDDGYFFAYDFDGTALVVAGQEWRIGKNWLNLEDRNGVYLMLGIDSTVGLIRYAIDYGLDR